MLTYLRRLLDTNLLAPHGFCFLWRPELLWTHVVADALIGLSYMTIPIALMVIILRRKDIPFSWVVWCFAIFILACGMTHFMMIWTLWQPYYGIEATGEGGHGHRLRHHGDPAVAVDPAGHLPAVPSPSARGQRAARTRHR